MQRSERQWKQYEASAIHEYGVLQERYNEEVGALEDELTESEEAHERDRQRLRRLALLYRNNRAMVKRLEQSNARTNERFYNMNDARETDRQRLRRVLARARWAYKAHRAVCESLDRNIARCDKLQWQLEESRALYKGAREDEAETALDLRTAEKERDELRRQLHDAEIALDENRKWREVYAQEASRNAVDRDEWERRAGENEDEAIELQRRLEETVLFLRKFETFEIHHENTGETEVWCRDCGELKHDGEWHHEDCELNAILGKLAAALRNQQDVADKEAGAAITGKELPEEE